MNDILINAYQNELTFMKQERNKWKERTKKAVKERNNLQSKIDKAIEVIDLITPELWNISNKMTYRLKDVKNILKGGEK